MPRSSGYYPGHPSQIFSGFYGQFLFCVFELSILSLVGLFLGYLAWFSTHIVDFTYVIIKTLAIAVLCGWLLMAFSREDWHLLLPVTQEN